MAETAPEHKPPEAHESEAPVVDVAEQAGANEAPAIDVDVANKEIVEESNGIEASTQEFLDPADDESALGQAERQVQELSEVLQESGLEKTKMFRELSEQQESLRGLSASITESVTEVGELMRQIDAGGMVDDEVRSKLQERSDELAEASARVRALEEDVGSVIGRMEWKMDDMNNDRIVSDEAMEDVINAAREARRSVEEMAQQTSALDQKLQQYTEDTISKLNDMAEAARKETEVPSGETPVSVASREVKGFNEERERELENLRETVEKIVQTIQWLEAGAPFVGVQEAGLDTSDVRYSDLPKLVGEHAIDWEDDLEAAAARAENDAKDEAEQDRLLDLLDEEEEQGREAIDSLFDAVEASHEGEPSPEVSAMVDAKTDALIEETGPGARSAEDTAQWWKDALAEQEAENAAKEAGEPKSDEDIVEDAAAEAAKRHAERMEYFDEENEESEAEKDAADKEAAAKEQGEAMEAFIAREDGTEAKGEATADSEPEVDGADTEPEVTGGVENGDEDELELDDDDEEGTSAESETGGADSEEGLEELDVDEDEDDTESATEVDDADSEEANVGGDDSGAETGGETGPEDGPEEAEAAPEGEPLPQEAQEQVVTAMEEEVLRDEPERTGWRKTVGWFAGRAAGLLTAGFTESFQADRFANATKEEAERLEDVMNSLEGLGPMAQEFRDGQNNNESLLDIYTRNSEIIGREVEQSVANLDAALLESKKMFKLFPVGPYRDQFSQKVMLMEKRVQDFKDRMLTQFKSEMQADAALTEHTVYQGIDRDGKPYERPNEVLVTKKEFRGEMRKALDKTWWSRKVYSAVERIPWLVGVKVLGGALLSTMSGSETAASEAA
ncbi:hypothetical protein HOI83_01860, partial [Candidatus Uhrbacteria bacterium]|nr:hypothetical protein [Candidatus Uhrbacteria bacterium]